jgi:hypothetical protein
MLARPWYTSPENNSLTAPDHYKSSQLCDPIGALPGVALRRFDLLPSLVAMDTDKAPRRLLLPASGCYDLIERVAPAGTRNQRDDLRIPVSVVRFGFAVRLLRALCFLLADWPSCGRVLALRLGKAWIPRFLRVACVRARRFLLDRVAVVTSTPGLGEIATGIFGNKMMTTGSPARIDAIPLAFRSPLTSKASSCAMLLPS